MATQYESKVIITKDGRREWIDSDSHFRDLIREYIGDSAAEWYEHRIESFGDIKAHIDKCFPEPRTLSEINRALDRMDQEQWDTLFWTLSELRGWDER